MTRCRRQARPELIASPRTSAARVPARAALSCVRQARCRKPLCSMKHFEKTPDAGDRIVAEHPAVLETAHEVGTSCMPRERQRICIWSALRPEFLQHRAVTGEVTGQIPTF